jgi:hypothetical protein
VKFRFTIRDLLWLTVVVAGFCAAIRWYLGARPELIVTNVRFIPVQPRVGEPVQPIIKYRNVGRKASGRFYLHQSEPLGRGYGGGQLILKPGEEGEYLWGGITFDHIGDYKFVFSFAAYPSAAELNEEGKAYTVHVNVREKNDETEPPVPK